MFTYSTKVEIHSRYKRGQSKSELAREYGCSPRTIGRVIDEVGGNKNQPTAPKSTPKVTENKKKEYKYYVVTDDHMISIIRVDPTGEESPQSEISYEGSVEFNDAKIYHTYGYDEKAFLALSKKHKIESQCMGKVTVHPDRGILEFNDGPSTFLFPADLTERVIEAARAKDQSMVTALMNFANKLANNPSKRSVQELYKFLKAADIKIREDGMVMCFKKVRSNYFDVHSGTFDNSVGMTPSMPRSMVDDDSDRTCSSGLHVCSKSYLPHFGGDRVMLCAVDPADVVSVPTDYNDAKMRVCRYEVVAEVTNTI